MDVNRPILSVVLLLLFACSTTLLAAFKKGDNYHGFKLLDKRFVKEVNAECLYFEHIKSGARLLKIAADDANKTFSIAFKTVTESDCGTPHIMEHSVLNGSKQFPVKSPFDVLAKGSLNTFLNAMTGKHMTIYPVASMNDKDYFNLMHVYLDAVLAPLIYDDERIFKQEGWHHELTDEESAVVYKGVVYNEMKGAFSSPTRELDYQIYKNLFPDTPYRFSSGGYPAAIPSLTFEKFRNYHRRYYHPSNSYIFLYGDADLNKELAFIDAEYLSDFEKADVSAFIPLQKPFKSMKQVTGYYPVTDDATTENQTYLTLNFVIGQNTDLPKSMALEVLKEVLVNQESAPIRLALQEAGIGKEVRAYMDDFKQNVFQIVVQNANPGDKDKFREIVLNTLRKTAEKGLDKEAVEGTLNRMEFRLREGDDAQKGITYNMRALTSWFFADDPFPSLEYEKPLAYVKKAVEKNYLESIILSEMVENPLALLLVLEPMPGLENENSEKIATELETFKTSLATADKKMLIKETQELLAYQKREDTPEALATIPLLDLKDINPKANWYSVNEKQIADVPVLHRDDFTNNVVYTRLYFDARVLPVELVPYAALLAEVMGSLNTDNYDYGDLDKALNIHTGGFNTYLNSYLENRDDNHMIPRFIVSSKVMNNKVDKLFELVGEIVNHTRYTDKERLKAVLTRHQSRLDGQIKRNGYGYSRTRLLSYFSNQGMFNEQTGGVEYYWFITDLATHFDDKADDIITNLSKTASLLFTKGNLFAATTCSEADLPVYSKGFEQFAKLLPDGKVTLNNWAFDVQKRNEGMLTASKVQYVLKGYDFKKLGYKWDGKMRVLNQIVSRDWLTNQVRVIGGAYGGFCSFSSTGMVYFASYRDPNLKETLDNFDGTPEYLKTFQADDKTMTRFIIGTVARMDSPLTPSEKGDVAFRRYFEKTKKEDLQREREAVLATRPDDIRSMEKLVTDILAQDAYCVYGNEEKIETERALFKSTVKLSK